MTASAVPEARSASSSDSSIRKEAERILRALAGDTARLRDDQWRAIEALVTERSRVLVVQRTGWGKSAVYFVATALLRAAGAGPTILISPLLALMRNQIQAAERAGIHAATMNSANTEDWDRVEEAISAGEIDILLVSPERLNNPGFRENVLPRLAATTGLLVVDEAHCISDWGHDFRPDYRRIRSLLSTLPAGIPVLATTATANTRVVDDVAATLGLGENGEHGTTVPQKHGTTVPQEHGTTVAHGHGMPTVLRGTLERESLRLTVIPLPSHAHRLGWLSQRLPQLAGSGIVYTLTVAQANDVASHLRTGGLKVLSYSGQDDTETRLAAENALLRNEVKALVATSALGMGFDKPDLGFVVHLGAPASPVAYYQQVGRAGRGVDRAEVVLLPGREDEDIWRYFSSLAFPPEEQVRAVLSALDEAGRALSTPMLETRVELSRSRLEMMLKVLDVDGAVRRVRGGWETTGAGWTYDHDRYAKVSALRAAEQQAMRDYVATGSCRMQFLRRQLDDHEAGPCGICDVCTRHSPSSGFAAGSGFAASSEPALGPEVDPAQLEAARRALNRVGVEIEPRVQWPSGVSRLGVELSGRVPADQIAESGRVLCRFSDIGWGPRLRSLLGTEPDGPLPEELLALVVQALAAWNWTHRPIAVVTVPSRSRPLLIENLATAIAERGQLPSLGSLGRVHHDGGRPGRANSAQRLAVLWDAFTVPEELRSRLGDLPSGPVLLVDDQIDSRWTMTVCARALRLAGAQSVLPFALAGQG